MNLKPLKQYQNPEYPIQAILEKHPELLRLIPKRWAQNRLVQTALGFACTLLLANHAIAAEPGNKTKPAASTSSTKPPACRVAPIFNHGDGRGGFGCVATAAPIFLTEDEAKKIIEEEAGKAGIHFMKKAMPLANVDIPVTDPFNCRLFSSEIKAPSPAKKGSVMLNGTDQQKHISYKYVSTEDFKSWENTNPGCESTAFDLNIKSAATTLQQALDKACPADTIAVFYDPVVSYEIKLLPLLDDPEAYNRMMSKDSKSTIDEKAQSELRSQVQDFIRWLKAQGII
jgi:hypothetical protein